jgi:hypothetical protein
MGMVDFRGPIHNNVSYVFAVDKMEMKKDTGKKARNTETYGMKGKAIEIHR